MKKNLLFALIVVGVFCFSCRKPEVARNSTSNSEVAISSTRNADIEFKVGDVIIVTILNREHIENKQTSGPDEIFELLIRNDSTGKETLKKVRKHMPTDETKIGSIEGGVLTLSIHPPWIQYNNGKFSHSYPFLEIHYTSTKDANDPGLVFVGANVRPDGLFDISYRYFNNGNEVSVSSVEEKLSGKFFYEKRKNYGKRSFVIRPFINGILQQGIL
jgi:hypothetical protein